MILDPLRPDIENNYKFKPDDKIFVGVLKVWSLSSQTETTFYCPWAADTKEECRTFWWFKNKSYMEGTPSIVEITVKDYLNQRKTSANPFETINLLDFRHEYSKKYPNAF